MIVVAGRVVIDPAKREEGVRAATEVMEETAKEPGCISYTFSADLTDPGTFRIFEEWESQTALDAHFTTPHMARFGAAIGQLGVKEMAVQRYEVSSVGPLRG
jgi:quinol monooxygenase YgiN